jgi:hypothetical protein
MGASNIQPMDLEAMAESQEETDEIKQDPDLMERLQKSVEQEKAGETVPLETVAEHLK